MMLKSARSSNLEGDEMLEGEEENENNAEDLELWLTACGGLNKKGRIFGLGSEAPSIQASCSASYTSSSHATTKTGLHPAFESELERRVDKLTQMNERLMSLIEDQKKEMKQMGRHLTHLMKHVAPPYDEDDDDDQEDDGGQEDNGDQEDNGHNEDDPPAPLS